MRAKEGEGSEQQRGVHGYGESELPAAAGAIAVRTQEMGEKKKLVRKFDHFGNIKS